MTKLTRIAMKTLGLALVAGCLAVSAVAEDDGALLNSRVIGSNPLQTIGGVPSGGAAWVVSKGRTILNGDGSLNLRVEGLLLQSNGTTGPVTEVSASLVCGGSGGTVMATTAGVPLTPAGNAHVHEKITLPASCIGPVILVRVAAANGTPVAQGPFIAATGFTNAAPAKESDDAHESTDKF
jgi:hypothetical protein